MLVMRGSVALHMHSFLSAILFLRCYSSWTGMEMGIGHQHWLDELPYWFGRCKREWQKIYQRHQLEVRKTLHRHIRATYASRFYWSSIWMHHWKNYGLRFDIKKWWTARNVTVQKKSAFPEFNSWRKFTLWIASALNRQFITSNILSLLTVWNWVFPFSTAGLFGKQLDQSSTLAYRGRRICWMFIKQRIQIESN